MALSISGAMTVNFLFLGIILYRKLQGYSLSYLATGLGKVFASALLMGIYIYWLRAIMADWMQQTFLNELAGVFFFVLSGALLYGVALYLIRLHEFRMLADKLLTKMKG